MERKEVAVSYTLLPSLAHESEWSMMQTAALAHAFACYFKNIMKYVELQRRQRQNFYRHRRSIVVVRHTAEG